MWGVVADTAMSDTDWHCLVVLADGTASMYTSGAFGIIGAGTDGRVRAASERLLRTVERDVGLFAPSNDNGIPTPGEVAIRALTFGGPAVLVVPEEELASGRHAASPLFFGVHEVITQMRRVAGG